MRFFSFFSSALWSIAFRPFFLGAAFHSLFAILVWILILFSVIPSPFLVGGIQMHAYEMVFGFSRAILVGFIFTAGQNWTKTVLIQGKELFFLFALWVLGRFCFLPSQAVSYASLTFDLYFDILVLFYILPPFFKKGQEHNRIVAVLYSIFFFLHVLTAFSFLGAISTEWSMHFVHLSVFSVLQFILLIAGRILPFFSSVAIAGSSPKKFPILEKAIQYGGLLFLGIKSGTYLIPEWNIYAGYFCISFSFLNFVRWYFWEPWKSIRVPILWILHTGYFWLSAGFLYLGLSHLGIFPVSSAYHIFTAGAIGVFVYGMITRVSLGHTGRPMRASKLTVLGYVFINLAVILRVFLPLWNRYREAYSLSAALWIGAFFFFLTQYAGILINPRADIKPASRA
ncbi:NnrS family protein [Leptospira langatensis]|uniref:NnrS family protein n=2 Tax=Leptospira langatensis TaxID=2484983 RepID=A0A5F1ZRV3_9LEPT|nr:NnrS family protein [Leptospira langatensis]TGK05631.1 NnrS family protein [Leptospira langatensis]TGL38762.1 NnrS family protein [Leptospira langatensis]